LTLTFAVRGRCGRDSPKVDVLTEGGLGLNSVFLYAKKSAEVIVDAR